MAVTGRPSLQTPEVVEKLCDAVSHGLSNADAAAIAGIDVRTFYLWMEDESFAQTIHQAIAERKLHRVKALETAEPGHWQRYAWLLERSDLRFCRLSERLEFMLREREEQAPKPTVDEEAKTKLDGEMRQMFKLPPPA
jgi:hypothetical protein